MEFFDKLKATLDTLTRKQFYMYIMIALGVLLFLLLAIMLYYYRAAKSAIKQINDLNNIRSTEVKNLLIRKERIKKQKEKVDAMIAQDPEFILGDVLDELLSKLDLSEKADRKQTGRNPIDDMYIETTTDLMLNDINMKQLVDFLEAIESSKRVYVKKLEIKTKTTEHCLEVNIGLAALVPKQT
jgi:hypothetical protein